MRFSFLIDFFFVVLDDFYYAFKVFNEPPCPLFKKLTSNKLDDFSQVRICHKKTNFTRVKQVPDIIYGLGSRRSLQLSSFFPGTTLQERSRLISRAAALYRAHIPCKRRTRLPIKIHSFGSEERVVIVIIQLHKVKYK